MMIRETLVVENLIIVTMKNKMLTRVYNDTLSICSKVLLNAPLCMVFSISNEFV